MGRPPLDPAIVAARRQIAAQPGTREEHAAEAGLGLAGWAHFCDRYQVAESVLDGPKRPRAVAPAPAPEPAPELRGLALAIDVLRRDRGELTPHQIRERIRALGRAVEDDLTPLLEDEAGRVGSVTWGAKLGTFRAVCHACSRPL